MDNTMPLPPGTPVQVISGRYRQRLGSTVGRQLADGLYAVRLDAVPLKNQKALESQFTRGQLSAFALTAPAADQL